MKKLLFISLFISIHCAFGQNIRCALGQKEKFKFGLSTNLVQLIYQSPEIEGIVVFPNPKFEFLAGVNLINGLHNQNNKRNIIPFQDEYMQDGDDRSTGYGYNTQLRYEILKSTNTANGKILAGIGFNHQQMNLKFEENKYIYNAPYYNYKLTKLDGQLIKNAFDLQLIFQHKTKHLFLETGIGGAYNLIQTDANLKTYRNFNKNVFDYGHKGLSPIFSMRAGYYF